MAGAIAKSNCLIIFINQLRDKVGVVYGSPEVTTGGRALKFYATIRMDVRRVEQLKVAVTGGGNEFIGSRTKVKIVKNKVAPPFKEAEFDIMYGKGISHEGEILDIGVKEKIIDKSGAWFSYNGNRLGQGRDNVKKLLSENKELADEIEAKIRANLAAQKSGEAANTEQIKQSIVKSEMEDKKPAKSKAAPTKSSSKAMLDIAIEDDEEL